MTTMNDIPVCQSHPIYFSLPSAMICSFQSDIADEGGNTNFNQANVHVKANKGSAIFFSYMDPIEKIMDYGFTTHSGCPVFSGEKVSATWIPQPRSQYSSCLSRD